jgi:hypothetical protein
MEVRVAEAEPIPHSEAQTTDVILLRRVAADQPPK